MWHHVILSWQWLHVMWHHVTPQLTVVVGAVGLTATNLEQDIIFIHSYQKPVSYVPAFPASPVLFCDVVNSFHDIVISLIPRPHGYEADHDDVIMMQLYICGI